MGLRPKLTDPAVAAIGLTETQARERGLTVSVATLPLSYVPRALAAQTFKKDVAKLSCCAA